MNSSAMITEKIIFWNEGGFIGFSLASALQKKITSELGWKTKLSFDKGLEKTIQWYLDNPEIINNLSTTVLDPTPWKNSN